MSTEHESMMGILKLYELRSEQTMRKARAPIMLGSVAEYARFNLTAPQPGTDQSKCFLAVPIFSGASVLSRVETSAPARQIGAPSSIALP